MNVFGRFRAHPETSDLADSARGSEVPSAEHIDGNELDAAALSSLLKPVRFEPVGVPEATHPLPAGVRPPAPGALTARMAQAQQYPSPLPAPPGPFGLPEPPPNASPRDRDEADVDGDPAQHGAQGTDAVSSAINWFDPPSAAATATSSRTGGSPSPGPSAPGRGLQTGRGQANQTAALEFEVAIDPTNSKLRRDLSILYLQAGRIAEAKEQARKAEELTAKRGHGPR